jgi:solute carrier family 25 (mitochondrial carnitine/acylcarnitine transporter), member 20/29
MERVKVLLQTQDQVKGGTKYKGMFDATVGLYREGGLRSLYRGNVYVFFLNYSLIYLLNQFNSINHSATLARDIPGSAAYFVAYEFFANLLKGSNESASFGAILFSGGASFI